MTSRVAEVAELADALGSGPSPRNWGWRFESSLRHSLKSSFLRRTLFLFLAVFYRETRTNRRNRAFNVERTKKEGRRGKRRRVKISKRRRISGRKGLKRRENRRSTRKIERRKRDAAKAPLFFRARPDTMKTTIVRETDVFARFSLRTFVFVICFRYSTR